jgi:hypothetical protein
MNFALLQRAEQGVFANTATSRRRMPKARNALFWRNYDGTHLPKKADKDRYFLVDSRFLKRTSP